MIKRGAAGMPDRKLFMENFYILDDGRVRQFLITGKEYALLIDTGFATGPVNVKKEVSRITELPLTVILTHGDKDHAGGLKDFGSAFLHKEDWPLVPEGIRLEALEEGMVFQCGGYTFETVEIPGHTYGSVAFADWDKGMLFAGDSVQKEGPIYLFGAHRNLGLYIQSQEKLAQMAHRFRIVYPCHHACPVTPDYIAKNLEDARALQAGTLTGQPTPGMPCLTYQGQWTAFFCTEEDRQRP